MLRWLPVALTVLLAACQSPPTEPTGAAGPLSASPTGGNGRIALRPYLVSDATRTIMGATAFKSTLYDVTGPEPRFLGALDSRGMLARQPKQDAIEYDAAPGNHLLMLHMRSAFGGDHVDFVEVPVRAGVSDHVAITQAGMNDRPMFAPFAFDERAARFCSSSRDLGPVQAQSFFASEGIPQSNNVLRYCATLSAGSYVHAAATDWTSPLSRQAVTDLKARYLPEWRARVKP